MTLRLTRLDASLPIVNPDGTPTAQFLRLFNGNDDAIERNDAAQAEAIEAIAAAQAAADAANEAAENANTAAESVTASDNLGKSFVADYTPPMVEADNAGNVTIANHDRVYGDGTSVPVTGDTLATGEVNPAYVYIYYDDPARTGGAVTYEFSTTEADAAQIGDRHSVGAVQIPAAGTASGGYARPPGYGGVEP
jgi:hypothetical protein